jgi:hypothetical protein
MYWSVDIGYQQTKKKKRKKRIIVAQKVTFLYKKNEFGQIEIGEGPNNEHRWERAGSSPADAMEILNQLAPKYEIRFVQQNSQ